MVAQGLSASTIDSTLNPIRAIYRYAIARNETTANPTSGLETPAIRSKVKRIASPDETRRVLARMAGLLGPRSPAAAS